MSTSYRVALVRYDYQGREVDRVDLGVVAAANQGAALKQLIHYQRERASFGGYVPEALAIEPRAVEQHPCPPSEVDLFKDETER